MKISACMIAKNEERCIARCINSYLSIVDEVIVVDTGSTDRTVEIARSLSPMVKIFHFAWIDDFAAAKNYALDQVDRKSDWIIFLDADEWFADHTDQKLRDALQKYLPMQNVQSTRIMIHNFLSADDQGNHTTFMTQRIWKNIPGARYHGAIHEALLINGKSLHATDIPSSISFVYHDGYLKEDVRTFKLGRNLSILLEEIVSENPRNEAYAYASRELYANRQYWPMLICALRYHEVEPDRFRSSFFAPDAFNAVSLSVQNLRMDMHAYRRMIKRFLTIHDDMPGIRLLKGAIYFLNGLIYEGYAEINHGIAAAPELTMEALAPLSFDNAVLAVREAIKASLHFPNPEVTACIKAYFSIGAEPSEEVVLSMVTLLSEEERVQVLLPCWREKVRNDEILLKALSKRRPSLAFFQVFETWFATNGQQDLFFITMLMAIEEYEQALTLLIERTNVVKDEAYALKAIAVALRIGSDAAWKRLIALPYERIRRIVGAWMSQDPAMLQADDEDALMVVADELLSLRGHDSLFASWAFFISKTTPDIAYRIAQLLYEHRMYQEAIPWLERAFDRLLDIKNFFAPAAAAMLSVAYIHVGKIPEGLLWIQKSAKWRMDHAHILNVYDLAVALSKDEASEKAAREAKEDFLLQKGAFEYPDYISDEFDEKLLQRIERELSLCTEPQEKALLTYRAGVVANRMKRVEDAHALFLRAFEQEPALASKLLSTNSAAHGYIYRETAEREVVHCPLCGRKGALHGAYASVLSATYNAEYAPVRVWRHCEDCSHIFAAYLPINAERQRIYEGMQQKSDDGISQHGEMKQIWVKRFSQIVSVGRMLSIGVRDDEFLRIAEEEGWEVRIKTDLRLKAQGFSDEAALSVQSGFLSAADGEKFHAIVIGEALQCSEAPGEVLDEALACLEEGGLIYTTIPDHSAPMARLLHDENPVWRIVQYTQYFSRQSLEVLLREHGLRMVTCRDSLLYLGYMDAVIQRV